MSVLCDCATCTDSETSHYFLKMLKIVLKIILLFSKVCLKHSALYSPTQRHKKTLKKVFQDNILIFPMKMTMNSVSY